MVTTSQMIEMLWQADATLLTDREINLLFEIYGPFPVTDKFTLRSGLIGLGKSQIMIQNQDQLSEALFRYINSLSQTQQIRVKELVGEWEPFATKVVKFTRAERAEFRVAAPEEIRKLILKRLQTYIPIYKASEVPSLENDYQFEGGDNSIMRG